MASDVRRAKKTFNVISKALIDQLLTLYAGDKTLIFLKDEIERCGADRKQDHVPAGNFFNTMNIKTKIIPDQERMVGEEAVVVGELVIRKDPRLFTPETGVTIPILEAMGLCEKWPKLSEVNKEMVWGYLVRMAKAAAQVVMGMQILDPKIAEALRQVQSTSHLKPGATEAEVCEFTKKVKEAMEKV